MEQVDWSSLHRILGDSTRRNILELIKEKDAISYTEIMSILRVTNTGRLNYHLKALNGLISKDDQGKYHLTERGQLAVNLLQTFPERPRIEEKNRTGKIMIASFLIFLGVILIFATNRSLATNEVPGTFSSRVIPQNTSTFLTEVWFPNNGSQFTIHLVASNSISLYVVNSTQYSALEQQYSQGYFLVNFTGMPAFYVDRFTLQSASVSLSLPQGVYYLFVGSNTSSVLDSLTLAQQQHYPLLDAVPGALGIFMVSLAILILTRRVWR